jgi:hypothetical protein
MPSIRRCRSGLALLVRDVNVTLRVRLLPLIRGLKRGAIGGDKAGLPEQA